MLVHQSGVCIPVHFPMCVCAPGPVHAVSSRWLACAVRVFCCPSARRFLMLVVAFVFPGDYRFMSTFLPANRVLLGP